MGFLLRFLCASLGGSALPNRFSVALLIVLSTALWTTLLASTEAQAQAILRDTETELFLQEISAPLYRASRIQADRVKLYIEDTDAINAFATASHLIVLSAGLMETATDPSDLQGVLAHEIGHIVAGHHVAASQARSQAERRYLWAAAAGLVLAGVTQDASAAIAGTSLGQEVAVKGYLAHSRANEQAADQAALSYLRRAMISPEGLLRVNRRLKERGDLLGEGDIYWRTHPLTSDRVALLRNEVEDSPYSGRQTAPELAEQFRRIQKKLIGFRHYKDFLEEHGADNPDIAIRYGRSLALMRDNRFGEALEVISGLVEQEPENPYFHEVRGQVLHMTGNATQAAEAYAESVRLQPNAPLLRLAWAGSLLATQSEQNGELALRQLRTVQESEASAHAWRLTQLAYARAGREGRALLAQSERSLLEGRNEEAAALARRAYEVLPDDDGPGKFRASDILDLLGQAPPE